jgi:hypothetical protein
MSAGTLVLLDLRHLNIYFDTEAEVASAVLTIKYDRVYNKIRAQLEGELRGKGGQGSFEVSRCSVFSDHWKLVSYSSPRQVPPAAAFR